MAFEDLIVGGDGADEPTAIVSPDLIATRNERKGLTDVSARARQPVDFGTDDEVIGPAPTAHQQTIDFGTDDEVIGSAPIKNPPMPRARPAEAPGLIQPTQAMPEVQPLDNAPFRAPSSGMDTNMLTGEEAYAERQASISGAQQGVAEAQARLDAAKARSASIADGSTRALRRGTTGDLQRQQIQAEVDAATENLAQAQQALSAAERAAPPTQTKTRDAASRFATAVGTTIPDVIGGIARPIDAGLDAVGLEGGTGIAEKMRGISRKVGIENQPDPVRQEELSAALGQGGGSAIGFIVTGAIGKAAKIPAAFASGGAGAAQNAEQYYREADDMGAPAYKKALAYAVGAGIGSTEAIGLGRIADELDKKTGGGLKRYFGLIMKEMGEEGLQEAGQQLLDNLVKLGLYGKYPGDITAGMAQGALVGMILGGGMAGTLGLGNLTAGRDRAAREGVPTPDQATVTPEEIIRQILGEPSTPPVTQPAPTTPTTPNPVVWTPQPAAPAQEEPPVPPQQVAPEETVRFYHGGKYGQEQGPADGTPKWLTPDEAYARDYKSDGKPNEVYFVDIPKSQIPPDGFDEINGRYRHFNAPEAIAGQLKPLAEKAPTKAEVKAASDEESALLRGYGYTDEQIADMSPSQREQEVAAAKEAGTEPVFGEGDAVVGSRSEPVKVETPADLQAVTNHVATDYTPAQGEANNRKLGHMSWNGLDASIEAGPGQGRKWLNKTTGESGETVSPAAIGYFKGTVGGDGMHLDVYFGPNPASKNVWVIDEQDGETGKWRQHKVMAGFDTEQEARDAYLGTSSKSEKTLSAITPMSVDELKDWIANGDLKKSLVTTKAVTPRQQPKATEPMSLLQFIASKGGLAPNAELTAIGLGGGHRVNVPGRSGRFPVVRAMGESLDLMREAAEEAGYFRGTGEATSTPREFLDAIDNELRGQRRLPEGQEAEPSKREIQRLEEENANRDALLAQSRAEIEAMLETYGVPAGMTNEADLRLAAEIMADEGLDPDAALERAAIRNLENDPDIPQETVYDAFDFGAFDAVQPQPTPEDERGAEGESAAGVRPGEEGRADEPVEHVSGAGEDREGPGEGEAREEAERAEQPSEEVPERVAPTEEEQTRASRAMDAALDKIEEAVEAGDRKAVLQAGRDARKVLADTPQSVKDADPEYWGQFKRTISDMLKPGYVTAQQQHYKEIQEAPTWAEILHKLPMIDDRNRDTDLAFSLMAAITKGPVNKQRFDDLTGPERHELMKLVSDPFHNPAMRKPTTERTEAGEQTVLPGAEKESEGKQAQRKADQPLKPKAAQKPADEGLFGDDSKQTDLLDLPRARESGPSASEDLDLDSIIDQAIDKYAPEEKPAPTKPTAGKAAKFAAKNTAMGLAEVAKGLDALFRPKGKLGAGPSFDEETYAKAKPFFMAGVAHFAEAGRDIKAMIDELVKHLVQTAGMGREAIVAMRPYLKQFAQDVASGAIDLSQQETDNGAAESADERSGPESAGQEALDGVSAAEGGGAASAGDVGRGAAGSSDLGADRDRAAQEPGLSGERGAGGGAAEVHPAAAGAGRGRAGARAGGKRGRVSEAPAGTDRSGGEPAGPVTPAEAPNLPALNYRITDETELGQGSEGVKFRDNIAAIETLKIIERENRRATPAEQRTLARYVGWGGLANAFRDTDGNLKPDWKDRGEQLESLLTKDELAAARRSTRNAHYTSRTVVDAMWEAARHLGFKGGLALELSSGTGNFLGLVPDEIAGNTRFVAVEFDSITARIAKALYPQDTVLHSGLHKLPLPEGEAVLNIGNPPFGSESLRFQYKPELNGLSIHNQFFLAGLDALQPGGLQILVVSRYLMDAQDTRAREMLAKKAKLLGAIRLPDTAFKENARTEVVTDILFLQRHTAAEEEYAAEQFENAKDERKVSDIPDWVKTTTVRDPLGGEPMVVNSYFARKPNMVMGKLERSGSMREKGEVNVTLAKGADLGAMLRKAIQTLPRNVLDLHQEVMDATLKRYQTMGESLEIALAGHEVGHVEQTDGKLYQISERETPTGGYEPVKRQISPDSPWSRQLLMDAEGRWYTLEPKVDEKGTKVKSGARNVYERKYFEGNVVPAAMRLGKAKYDKLKALVDLRDLTKRQLTLEAEDAPAAEMEGNRKKLADAYQAFVGSNGYLNDAGNLRLLNDLPDGALVLALETGYRAPVTHAKAARTGETAKPASAKPSPIMSRRVVPKYEPATRAETAQDALSISLSEVGHADMDRIAELLGKTREEAIEELTAGDKPLLYKDPETGAYETANGYLSGNVVRKLKAAEAAGITKNVEALQKVQPERWSAENISAMPGANWIPPQVYADFATHMLGVPAKVHYSQVTNSFNLYVDDYSREKADQWGTADITADAILRGILNSRVPKVIREDGEGRKYVDQEATALVSLKAKEIENEFADWVFADSARRNLLTDIYNEKFNTRVNRQHDGSHLTLPGKVPDEVIKLRRHQKNAVWRGIYERFMLLDHVVGAGKTFTAIARVMERRRMGLSRKPMIVVPNHLVDQWTADVYRLYPGAKVLAAGKNQFEKKGRRRLFAKIATGDWDVVIVPHSSFGFIGISPETETRFLEEELRIAQEAVEEARDQAAADGIGGRSKPFTVKEAERLVTTIEGRLDSLKKASRDNMLTFEQMGVDDLTVDEAHEFKNLFYSSRLTGVRGMGDKSGSQKAFDLYNKVRVLRDSPNGTVTFMTGTPISNSAVEMYTMMRYLSAQDLKDLGIEHFDAWRSQYVSATAKFEPTEAGGLKEVTRLGRNWSNMRALMELYYSFTDAVSQEDINRWYAEDNNGARFPVPKVKTGGRKEVVVKPTEAQSAMLRGIVAGFNGLPNISDPYERNAERLKLMDRARKVSLDARAADATVQSEETGGKLDQIADKIADIYDRTQADAGTQLVFIDRSVPAAKSDKKVIKDYDDLIARRDAALAAGDEAKYRDLVEQLEKFDANEIETLRAAQKGGWNAYDQLKSNLIARGIPADEIRFVQEANNDAEKKALFDAVNDGTVRVLIGSTPRMGAGTNVQERLVALHHGDVTWKPSDIEQREGRIIRQGNKLLEKYGADNFEVDILAYVTERTVDAKMWDLNATKLKMINGIRKYDGAFNMEFEDEDSVGMAEIAALASGDPLLLERVKLIAEIDKLELLERAHRRKMFGIDDAIYDLERAQKNYPGMIEAGKAKAAAIQSAIDTVRRDAAGRTVEVEGKSYSIRLDANNAVEAAIEAAKAGDENARYAISINGQRVTNREMAQALLNEAIGDPVPIEAVIDGDVVRSRTTFGQIVARKATELLHQTSRDTKKPVRIGKMLGYNLELGVYPDAHRISLALTDNGATIVDVEQLYVKEAKGFVPQSGRALIDKLEGEIDYEASFTGRRLQDKLDEAKTRLPSLREERGKPFPKAEELKSLRDRLEEVIKTLDQRTKDAESGRLTDEQASIARYSIVRRSSSLTGAEIDAPELLQHLQLPHGRFWADYTKLAKKHPEVFTSPEQVREHVESVLSDPDLAIPQRSGNVDLVKRSDLDRMIGFRAHLKNGRYTISTAYVLEPGQLERMKSGAAHAGATVLELNSKDHLSGQGRVSEYNRADGTRQAAKGLTPERRANLERALTDVVRKIAGPSVRVRFVDEHPINMAKGWGSFGQDKVTAAGSYLPAQSLITVALADPAYPLEQVLDTTFHEAFHALEDNILTEQEMAVLKREDARLREIVKRAYGFTDEQIGEIAGFEIRAMAFEYYAARRAQGLEPQGLHIGIRRAFERLIDLFRRVRNALNGLGYRNASDIFEAAYDGAYADRRAAATDTVTEQARINSDFRRWFGQSKVVDKAGNPLVVYHGTDADFDTFERTEDIGFHFGTARAANARVGASPAAIRETLRDGGPFEHQEGRAVMPVYIKIENPLRLPDLNDWSPRNVIAELERRGIITQQQADDASIVDREAVRDWLKAKGYDGIVYRNRVEGNGRAGDSYIVFEPTQIKSATANRGTFDQNDQRIQYNVRPQGNLNRFESYEPLPERWQDWWKRPDLNWRDRAWGMLDAAFLRANRALGDRYVDMRRLQAAVELTGRQVNEGVNMALAATLFEGRTEKRLKDYWIKLWKPALDFAYSQGVTREELHRYLYARHAPERNAHIAEINPMMPEGGSGMTDTEAQEIMDGFAAAGKLEALEQVAQRIDGIVRKIRSMMVDDQLEHEETIGQWEQAYQHYVPLRGFESGDEDMAQDLQVSRTGKGFDVRGPETKQALGRSSKADDVLTNLFLMGERTIIRGEQNRVGRTAMRFMQSNPQPSLYEVSRSERVLTDGRVETTTESDLDLLEGERPITVRRINRETGLVETVTRVASGWSNDSFAVKVGGHTYYIRIKHQGLLTALKNVGIQRLPWLIQAHSWLTRQFSAFRTARNPDFFVPNLFRDVQDAAYTLGAEQRTSLVKNFALNIGTLRTYVAAFMGELMEKDGALGDIARRKFADKRGAQLYEDWKKHGGQIAFMGINDLDSARREIEAAFHETEESYAVTVAKAPYRLARSILKAIEFFNGAIEAGTRLAVYDAGLKAGMTKNKAAELSKESTTNFNRKGIYSPFINAFYAFFNARVQGGAKIIRLLRNSKMARRAAIGLVVGGFATTLWNLAVSPDDEDKKPEYMRRKYWERERYFIFYFPGAKDPIRIPMGYGLQVFWMLGENLAMASQGKITPAQAAANYLSTIVSAFSPLQAEGSASDPGTWLRYIMPSMEMPLLELGTNEDWRRKPIHPKFGKKGEPHSEQYFSTTSPYAIDVAQFLNKVSGGNAFKPGAVDIYPGDLQYIWNFATGGLGQTTNRTSTMFKNWLEGVPTPPNQVPILRHFVGANVEQATGEAYYEAWDEVQRGMAQVRKAMKAPAANDDAAATIEEGTNRFGVHQGKRRGTVGSDAETVFRNTDKQIKGLRALEQAARQDKTMDSKTRSETIAGLRQQMREVQEQARKAYRDIKQREPTS